MTQRLHAFLLALTLSVTSVTATASETKPWEQAASLYEGKDYKQAITRYEQLLQQEGPRAGIYYNLASCYYQLGDLGHARLYIERSLQLDPRDEAAQANRQLIRAKSIDRLADGKGWVERTGEQMAYALPLPLLIVLSLLLFALAAAAFVRFFLVRRRSARRWSFYTGLGSLALSLFTLALILHWVHEQHEARHRAVIIHPEVSVFASGDADAEALFSLHEGTLIRIKGEPSTALQRIPITLPDGRHGWIPNASLEYVVPRPALP
jgi:batE, TRP domain containing protein